MEAKKLKKRDKVQIFNNNSQGKVELEGNAYLIKPIKNGLPAFLREQGFERWLVQFESDDPCEQWERNVHPENKVVDII